MSNPVFDNSAIFGDPRKRPRGRAPQGTVATASSYGTATAGYDAASLNQLYEAPSATTADTGRLTYDDVIMKTAGLLAVLVLTGAATWILAPGLWIAGAVVGLVLGMVNAFKKSPSPALILLYAAAEGVFLGGISAFFEAQYKGLVGQAVLATLAVFGTSLVLFRSGKVRVTPKFTKVLMLSMVGYLAYSFLNVVFMLFGVGGGTYGPLRSGLLGIVVGLVAVGLAAMSLIVDFDSIQRGVR